MNIINHELRLLTNDVIAMIAYSPEYSPCGEDTLNIQGPRDLQKCIVWHQFWHPKPNNHELPQNNSLHEYKSLAAKLKVTMLNYLD